MAELEVSGGRIHWQQTGDGAPLVLVHGSWDELEVWQGVVPLLAGPYRVVTYDRRGHGRSRGGGPIEADADDLAALIEHIGAPAHVAANSFGGAIALLLATRRPELLRRVAVHEPPLLGLLGEDHPAVAETEARIAGVVELLRAGRAEEGVQRFVEEVALGPGAWEHIPAEARGMMVRNAGTFVEENEGGSRLSIDPAALARVQAPVLLSGGDESPRFFAEILDVLERTLPRVRRTALAGAGHVPHETAPDAYATALRSFFADAA